MSLSGQGTDDKKPKIGRIKAKIIYFKVSNFGKKLKNFNFQKIVQFLNLNNSLQEHFTPIKLYILYIKNIYFESTSRRLFENNKIAAFNIT